MSVSPGYLDVVNRQIAANRRRAAYLVAGFGAVVLAVMWLLEVVVGGGVLGFVLAVAVAAGSAAVGYWRSDAIVLALSGARPAGAAEHARLHNLVEGLCVAAGLPKPALYVIDDVAPNAFAVGRTPKHAAVVCTSGLLGKLSRIELEGVVAHELSHVKNHDIVVSTLAVTMIGGVVLLADAALRVREEGGMKAVLGTAGLPLLLLAPVAARVMRAVVGDRRELVADVSGVRLTRYPPGLASALDKLQSDSTVVARASAATAHLWIEPPLPRDDASGDDRRRRLARQFATHPPLDERIQALREL